MTDSVDIARHADSLCTIFSREEITASIQVPIPPPSVQGMFE